MSASKCTWTTGCASTALWLRDGSYWARLDRTILDGRTSVNRSRAMLIHRASTSLATTFLRAGLPRSLGRPETSRFNDRVDPSKYVCTTVFPENPGFRILGNDSVPERDARSLASSREMDLHYLVYIGLLK